MKTRITELLKIQYPIIQGGMVWAASSNLVAAVANAGGLGLLGSASMYPNTLREEIRKVKQMTNNTFGVNLSLARNDINDLLDICIEEGVEVVSCSLGNPKIYVEKMKANNIKTLHVVTNTKHGLKAQEFGVDAVIAVGIEAGGHPGPDELASMTLIPQLSDLLDIPVIASGGVVDGRGLVANIALGAEGVQMGTRFLMTTEATVHQSYKEKILKAGATDTILVARSVGVVRVLKNEFTKKIQEAEQRGATKEEINSLLRENRPKFSMLNGNVKGQIQAGQGVGLIHDIVPAKEVISRMVREYSHIMNQMPKVGCTSKVENEGG